MSTASTEKKHSNLRPWQPGQSGNPEGRKKGSRNKLGEAFLEDMLHAWESQGPTAIQKVIEKKPEVFLKVVADLMPKDVNLNVNPLDTMSDEQLLRRLRSAQLRAKPFLEQISADGAGSTH